MSGYLDDASASCSVMKVAIDHDRLGAPKAVAAQTKAQSR
jgi:hypothetical protein